MNKLNSTGGVRFFLLDLSCQLGPTGFVLCRALIGLPPPPPLVTHRLLAHRAQLSARRSFDGVSLPESTGTGYHWRPYLVRSCDSCLFLRLDRGYNVCDTLRLLRVEIESILTSRFSTGDGGEAFD